MSTHEPSTTDDPSGEAAGFAVRVTADRILCGIDDGGEKRSRGGILIPATFKYADNLIYSYARPSSIVVTCLFGAVMARAVPPLTMLAGVAIVVTSIGLYNSKPAEKTA